MGVKPEPAAPLETRASGRRLASRPRMAPQGGRVQADTQRMMRERRIPDG